MIFGSHDIGGLTVRAPRLEETQMRGVALLTVAIPGCDGSRPSRAAGSC